MSWYTFAIFSDVQRSLVFCSGSFLPQRLKWCLHCFDMYNLISSVVERQTVYMRVVSSSPALGKTFFFSFFFLFLLCTFKIVFSRFPDFWGQNCTEEREKKGKKSFAHGRTRTHDPHVSSLTLYHRANQVVHIKAVQASFKSLGHEVHGSIGFMVLIRISPLNHRLTYSKAFSSYSDHFQKQTNLFYKNCRFNLLCVTWYDWCACQK